MVPKRPSIVCCTMYGRAPISGNFHMGLGFGAFFFVFTFGGCRGQGLEMSSIALRDPRHKATTKKTHS